MCGGLMRSIDEVLPGAAASRLRSYRRAVERAVPQVQQIILFGSRARRQARVDSDYDVAVVVRGLSDRQRVRRMLSDLAYEHILDGFYIRPIPVLSRDLETNGRPTELVEDILRDGAEVR